MEEICSVSECAARGPDDWIDHWLHNELGFYDTPELAWQVAAHDRLRFSLFAYRLLCRRFEGGRSEDIVLPALSVAPIPPSFGVLGFDVVSKSGSAFFECSPLSCNGVSLETAVNKYCLVDSLAAAEALATRFAEEQPEPGAYFVVQVLREAR